MHTPDTNDCDERFMRIAVELAHRGRGYVEPNPMVGCVLVRDQQIIGQGFHRKFGGPHAEVEAIHSLESVEDANGATAYVTLEPCCHHGKTPPCAEALITAGVGRVVVAIEDPFPPVAGGGLLRLAQAGIETSVGVLRDEAERLAAAYLKRVRTGRPWVIAKWAMTIDGRIATATGQSQWISGESSRAQVHALRGCVDAIAVGMGTVEADDPLLTARPPGPRIAARAVFCRHRLPAIGSNLMQTAAQIPLILVVGSRFDQGQIDQRQAAGATILRTGTDDSVEMTKVALDQWGQNQMTNVMLEGGRELLGSFFSADQVDECHVFVGATAVGGMAAPGPIGGSGVSNLADAWKFKLDRIDQFDDDVRLIYLRK